MSAHRFIRARSLRRLIIITVALATVGVPVAGALAADGPSGVRVFTGDNPTFLLFDSANCAIRNGKTFGAVSHDRGWRLQIQVFPFTGFHSYDLVRGHFSRTLLMLVSPSGTEYASDFIPPHHISSGGRINFSDHGGMVGGGFYPMFNEDGSDAVGVAGVMTCHYPKRVRR
jgi:hypothetical protein